MLEGKYKFVEKRCNSKIRKNQSTGDDSGKYHTVSDLEDFYNYENSGDKSVYTIKMSESGKEYSLKDYKRKYLEGYGEQMYMLLGCTASIEHHFWYLKGKKSVYLDCFYDDSKKLVKCTAAPKNEGLQSCINSGRCKDFDVGKTEETGRGEETDINYDSILIASFRVLTLVPLSQFCIHLAEGIYGLLQW